MKNLNQLIKINDDSCEIIKPDILLEKRNGDVIGKLNYSNLHMSISGTDPDEITFDLYKAVEPLFDKVIDLKICHVVDYGRFEIAITKTCEETEVKSITGVSLETELAQSYLYEIHVNDEEYMERAAEKEIYIDDFDENENLIPIVFYNNQDLRHSLLHLLLADKATHWSYGYITPMITEDNLGVKKDIPANKFQRTFTFDGTDILSAMSEISKECNVIFYFNTERRIIDVYNRFELGEDTTVLINRRNLASSIQINDLKDEVKNCFRVSGGDDVITNYFSAVNITGNYIYDLSYQEEDMPEELSTAIHNYLAYKESLNEDYYGGYDVYDLLADVVPRRAEYADGTNYYTGFTSYRYLTSDYTTVDGVLRLQHKVVSIDDVKIVSSLKFAVIDYSIAYDGANDVSIITFTRVDSGIEEMIQATNWDPCLVYYTYETVSEQNNIPTYKGEVSSLPSAAGNLGSYYLLTTDNKYYISNGTEWEVAGAFVRYCSAVDWQNYYEHTMAPTVGLTSTNANEQAIKIRDELQNITTDYKGVAVNNLRVSSSDFASVTNNVLAYIGIIVDSRYTVKNIEELSENYPRYDDNNKIWTGKLKVYCTSDETDNKTFILNVPILNDNTDATKFEFAKQKIYKSLASNSTYEVDQYIVRITQGLDVGTEEFKAKIRDYMRQYNLTELKTFYDAFQSCVNVLDTYYTNGTADQSALFETIYTSYKNRADVTLSVQEERKKQVDECTDMVSKYSEEIATIQKLADFKDYLENVSETSEEDLWALYNSYRREDTYQNDNYISDGLNDGQILAKCKELLNAAQYNLSIACRLQHSLDVSISNLLIMKEFEPFWNMFSIYNYIRVQEDDLVEPYKLQLIQADIDFDAPEDINVTFATNLAGNGNVLNELESVITQSVSIGSSFSSVTQQSSRGNDAKSYVNSWLDTGLNMASTQVKNAENEEVTITNHGILCRSEVDEGDYDPFQIKLTGQGMYYTTDNWNTVSGCLGKIWVADSATTGHWSTGLIANDIIGNLIVGSSLSITNASGSFTLNGEKATFNDISINYSDSDGRYVRIGDGYNVFKIGRNNVDQLYFNGTVLTLNGSIHTADGLYSADLTSGKLSFKYNNTIYSEFGIGIDRTYGPMTLGTEIYSPFASKFIAFNIQNSLGASKTTNFIINNGLNPYGIQEGLIAMTGMCVSKLTFYDPNYDIYDPDQWFLKAVSYTSSSGSTSGTTYPGILFDPGDYMVIGDSNASIGIYDDGSPLRLTVHGGIGIMEKGDNLWYRVMSQKDFILFYMSVDSISSTGKVYYHYTYPWTISTIPYVMATVESDDDIGLTVAISNSTRTGATVTVKANGTGTSNPFYVRCVAIVGRKY